VIVKKPAANATSVPTPTVNKKAVAVKQAVPETNKVSTAKLALLAAGPKTAATSKIGAASASVSYPQQAGSRPVPSVPAAPSIIPMKKPATVSNSVSNPSAAEAPVVDASASMPVRSARPSSRLAQVTVPSMPQAVASTAAKSSFVQTAPHPLVTPLPTAVKKDPRLANNWKTKSAEELTDPEVIAMPDSEYMNEKQMAFFRLKLDRLRRGILDNAGETTEHLREDTVVVPDPADRATIEEEHALELRTRDRERKLLKKIEQSIQRIDSGDYGYCDETGEPIGVARLLARPTATLSLEAQQRRELKQKMFGD
jgi:DnaK suppressor protein